ncbi:hypothetical protein [Deinococcus multiflagellatus]|uniref:Uncharacterized protein n=1 Tax=Deinococcus multiflagellatus TaxID=1656887 RepID=A0ABW1ZE41_9DEIO|nr:hypothetical protein [Deinococcus multiflagellatus]MBZ9712870.1 hypothetical protein [Deinococcus multiflagellatus]
MGEAKRRKQLGLMPAVHPFEAHMDAEGTLTFTRAPEDARLREQLTAALKLAHPYGEAWNTAYRTRLVLHGGVDRFLDTAEDVETIPVPAYRRFVGELALGAQPEDRDLRIQGGRVRVREEQHSFDGQKWQSFPANADPRRSVQYLMQHPAASLQGEVVATVRAEVWREGRVDLEPEPPTDLLEPLETLAREWCGDTDTEWLELHRDAVDDDGAPSPQAKRVTFDLRRPAPLHSLMNMAFATLGNVEVTPQDGGAGYTLDGETWVSYEDGEAVEDGLPPELAQIFDLETVAVTVHADGRIEWDDGEVPEEDHERLRTELREATGAGDPAAWAAWTTELLTSTFAEELRLSEGQALPVPVAVRLDIPTDALRDPDPLAQTFMESEVSFDGAAWRDLYDEELPEELRAFAPGDA